MQKYCNGKTSDNLNLSFVPILNKSIEVNGKMTEEVKEAFINYGSFLQTVFDFLIVAVAVFAMIKVMSMAQSLAIKEKAAEPAAPPPIPEDIQLLCEIRDALAK